MTGRLPPTRLPPVTIAGRSVAHDGFIRLEVIAMDTVVRGEPVRLVREVHDHGNGAAVLAFDPLARTAVLVRQVRAAAVVAGTDGVLVEAIAGIVDDGETPLDTVRREAVEETGVTLGDVVEVGRPFSSPGTLTERTHLFLGEIDPGVPRGKGGGMLAEHEEIEVIEVPLAVLAEMADAREIDDLKTLLLVETLRRRRPELFA
jgi:nudix-type nucleoside diphosphatase (YffH/AdpP family)